MAIHRLDDFTDAAVLPADGPPSGSLGTTGDARDTSNDGVPAIHAQRLRIVEGAKEAGALLTARDGPGVFLPEAWKVRMVTMVNEAHHPYPQRLIARQEASSWKASFNPQCSLKHTCRGCLLERMQERPCPAA